MLQQETCYQCGESYDTPTFCRECGFVGCYMCATGCAEMDKIEQDQEWADNDP